MADVIKSVLVANTPTEVGSFQKWVLLKNNSDVPIYLSFVANGDTLLTTSNGYPLGVGEVIYASKDDANLSIALRQNIYAVHGVSGTKDLRVQGE